MIVESKKYPALRNPHSIFIGSSHVESRIILKVTWKYDTSTKKM